MSAGLNRELYLQLFRTNFIPCSKDYSPEGLACRDKRCREGMQNDSVTRINQVLKEFYDDKDKSVTLIETVRRYIRLH